MCQLGFNIEKKKSAHLQTNICSDEDMLTCAIYGV